MTDRGTRNHKYFFDLITMRERNFDHLRVVGSRGAHVAHQKGGA